MADEQNKEQKEVQEKPEKKKREKKVAAQAGPAYPRKVRLHQCRTSSFMAKAETFEHKWYIADVKGEILGRAAARIATVLTGKHRPTYTPHVDTGDFVVVINAKDVKVTGRKVYKRYSGFPSGQRLTPMAERLAKDPISVFRDAVFGMIPHTKLGKLMLRKLKVYPGPDHPHKAQKPVKYEIT
jgi:large subunit ribosomal protein L13